jgi:hypothetical protein
LKDILKHSTGKKFDEAQLLAYNDSEQLAWQSSILVGMYSPASSSTSTVAACIQQTFVAQN